MTKPFKLPKHRDVEAYRFIKDNAGSAGIDNQTLDDVEQDLKNNLYKIWNKLS